MVLLLSRALIWIFVAMKNTDRKIALYRKGVDVKLATSKMKPVMYLILGNCATSMFLASAHQAHYLNFEQDQALIGPILNSLKMQHPHFRTPQPHQPRAPKQDDPPPTHPKPDELGGPRRARPQCLRHGANSAKSESLASRTQPKGGSSHLQLFWNSQVFIINSVPVAKNHQRCLPLQFSFTYIFNYINHGYNAAALTL